MNYPTILIELNKVDSPVDARPHDPASLEILAHDMGEQGELQEIIVEAKDGRYTVIAGVGRTLAARKLGWKEIRASVRENVSNFDKARITFAENEDREDADAFYQARMIEKMLKAKNCSRQALGKELGISDALIDAYVSVNRLPDQVRGIPKRLGIGLLVQIVRLNRAKDQIYLAKKCVRQDLSVRQVKAWVDKRLGVAAATKPAHPAAAPIPDPLAKTWEKLEANSRISPDIHWEVHYGAHKLEKGSVQGWFFFVQPQDSHEQAALARWFRQMSQGLSGEPVKEELPEVIQDAQKIEAALTTAIGTVRMPRTAAEERELEQIAVRGGPKAVYAWIYGQDSFMTQAVPAASWKDIGQTPKEGLRGILEGIKASRG